MSLAAIVPVTSFVRTAEGDAMSVDCPLAMPLTQNKHSATNRTTTAGQQNLRILIRKCIRKPLDWKTRLAKKSNAASPLHSRAIRISDLLCESNASSGEQSTILSALHKKSRGRCEKTYNDGYRVHARYRGLAWISSPNKFFVQSTI